MLTTEARISHSVVQKSIFWLNPDAALVRRECCGQP